MSIKLPFQRSQPLRILSTAVAAMIGVAGYSAAAHASVIVSDTFTAATATPLPGSTPDIGPAGATWLQNGYSGYQDNYTGGLATVGADVGNGISLTGVTATTLTLSDTFNLSKDSNSGQNAIYTSTRQYLGVGLGFFRQPKSGNPSPSGYSHGWDTFTGLVVDANGELTAIKPNSTNSNAVVQLATTTATESVFTAAGGAAATHTFSYTVNLATGSISSILLDGTDVTADLNLSGVSGNPFASPASSYAGFYNSTTGYQGNITASFGAFQVTAAVPEPASLGLVGVGAAILLLAGRRKSRA